MRGKASICLVGKGKSQYMLFLHLYTFKQYPLLTLLPFLTSDFFISMCILRWGRSPNMSPEERHETCEEDTIRSFLDMTLLGYSDLLVISKRSTFTFFPSLMMAVRKKPVCMFVDGSKSTHFSCQTSSLLEKTGLVTRLKKDTGLAPSSRL